MEKNQTTNEEVSQDTVAEEKPEIVKVENPILTGEKQESIRDELGRIKPGHSLNPDGRPLGAKSFSTKVKDALEKLGGAKIDGKEVSYEEALIKKILHKAIVEGDSAMIKLIWNYLDGMPSQTLNHQGGVVVTTLSVEERNKLEDILYGPKERTTEEPVDSTAATEAVEQGSAGDSNQWKSGAEEIPLQS